VKTLAEFIKSYELITITIPDKTVRYIVIVELIKTDYLHILDDVIKWLLAHIEE
jgi:hypothetical protein